MFGINSERTLSGGGTPGLGKIANPLMVGFSLEPDTHNGMMTKMTRYSLFHAIIFFWQGCIVLVCACGFGGICCGWWKRGTAQPSTWPCQVGYWWDWRATWISWLADWRLHQVRSLCWSLQWYHMSELSMKKLQYSLQFWDNLVIRDAGKTLIWKVGALGYICYR